MRRGETPLAIAPLVDDRASFRLDTNARDPEREIAVSFVASDPEAWGGAPAGDATSKPPPRSAQRAPGGQRRCCSWRSSWRAWQDPASSNPFAQDLVRPHIFLRLLFYPSKAFEQGWSGQVLDADDDHPVAGARLQLSTASFARSQVVAEATSDAAGRFVLSLADPKQGPMTLRVMASQHRPLEQRLERPAEPRDSGQAATACID